MARSKVGGVRAMPLPVRSVGRPRRGDIYPTGEVPEHLLSVDQLALRTGLTVPKVRTYLGRCGVQAVARTGTHTRLYDVSTVNVLIDHERELERNRIRLTDSFSDRSYTEDESIRIYAALREGKSVADIVIELKIDDRKVELVRQRYARMSGGFLLPAAIVERLNKLPVDGCFPLESPEALADMIEEIVRENQKTKRCARCREHERATECRECVERAFVRQVQKEAGEQAASLPANGAPIPATE